MDHVSQAVQDTVLDLTQTLSRTESHGEKAILRLFFIEPFGFMLIEKVPVGAYKSVTPNTNYFLFSVNSFRLST